MIDTTDRRLLILTHGVPRAPAGCEGEMHEDTVSQHQLLVSSLQASIRRHARYSLGLEWDEMTCDDMFKAVSMAARDLLIDGMLETEHRYERADAKRLYYLSMEFLMGRSLGNNLYNLGIHDVCNDALLGLGVDLEEVRECERDAALGNGGLGRLAACFLDSLATLGMPGFGYGINYQYGLFKQIIERGYQKERPDDWMASSNPWLIEKANESLMIPVYGRVEEGRDANGTPRAVWKDWKVVVGVPHDMPVVGYGGKAVNYLRLFSARSSQDFDMQIFNQGEYLRAVQQKIASETVSKVLYPSDSIEKGRELRLLQEYFLVACAVRDIMRRYEREDDDFEEFSSHVAIHLNDTHPALTVAELMRFLIDDRGVVWEKAWRVTKETLGFTNHTLMPEALESWPVRLMERIVPRHLQIIREIDSRFLERVSLIWPGDDDRARRVAIISPENGGYVRMANLSIIGSHAVNGVAGLHTELIKRELAPEFYELWPERFHNKTNGVTQRRWLLKANPPLADLLTSTIGSEWITDLDALHALEPHAADQSFQETFADVKQLNKVRLAETIAETAGISVDPHTLFDVHIKRMHEYKRQLLNVLRIVHEYLLIVEDGKEPAVPRTYIFAGKAAPGYWAAKQIIKLINNIGATVNRDERVRGLIKVAFIPDYRVSLAERIIPAADISEQISTAGTEASGTGNMKLSMNGALTMGTLDGANVEILAEVGEENIYIFGLTVDQISEMRRSGSYDPHHIYSNNEQIRRVMDCFSSNRFSRHEPGLFEWIYKSLIEDGDHYFHLADLPSYIEAQDRASAEYADQPLWRKKAILNVARIGRFSSDRTIREYARDVWGIKPVL